MSALPAPPMAPLPHTTPEPGLVNPPLPPPPLPAPQVIYIESQTTRSAPEVYENYPQRTSLVLGVGRVVVGCLTFTLMVVAIVLDMSTTMGIYGPNTVSITGSGIWCGLFVSTASLQLAFNCVSSKVYSKLQIYTCSLNNVYMYS